MWVKEHVELLAGRVPGLAQVRPQGYARLWLHRGGQTELMAADWPAGVRLGLHGHGGAAAVYAVVAGAVEEERYLLGPGGYRCETQVLGPGATTCLPPRQLPPAARPAGRADPAPVRT